MSVQSPPSSFVRVSPLADALRLHRRICLLRTSGQDEEADRLERGEFSSLVESIQAGGEQAQLAPLLAAEETRVAEAMVLAELIAPLLAARLTLRPMASPAPANQAHRSGRSSAGPIHPASVFPPSIAEFIDGMLEQERASTRSG